MVRWSSWARVRMPPIAADRREDVTESGAQRGGGALRLKMQRGQISEAAVRRAVRPSLAAEDVWPTKQQTSKGFPAGPMHGRRSDGHGVTHGVMTRRRLRCTHTCDYLGAYNT